MTTVTATLAEQAAAAMGNDGSKLVAPDGRTMDDVMEQSRYCTDGLGRNDWHRMYITPESFTADVEYLIDNAELVEEIHRFFSDVQDFDAWVTLTRTDNKDYPILAAFSNGRGGATTNGNCVWGEWGDYIGGDVLKLDDWGVNEEGREVTICIDEDGNEYHQCL